MRGLDKRGDGTYDMGMKNEAINEAVSAVVEAVRNGAGSMQEVREALPQLSDRAVHIGIEHSGRRRLVTIRNGRFIVI